MRQAFDLAKMEVLTKSQQTYYILFEIRPFEERKGNVPRANIESIAENSFYIVPKDALVRRGVWVTYNMDSAFVVISNSVSILIYTVHGLSGG